MGIHRKHLPLKVVSEMVRDLLGEEEWNLQKLASALACSERLVERFLWPEPKLKRYLPKIEIALAAIYVRQQRVQLYTEAGETNHS